MKRSEINKALKELEKMIADHQYYLPKFANFTPEEWKTKGHEFDEIRYNMLGWDITDYGMGDFDKYGFSLFTIRNGNIKMKDKYKKPYAEKFLYLKEGQYALNHFHWYKMEDIINRGGGNILITRVNGMEVSLTGQNPALIVLHKDEPGTIAAVTELMAEYGVNICNFHLARETKGGLAVMTIESDSYLGPELNERINQLENIYSSTMLERV